MAALYSSAAKIIEIILKKKGTVKSLVIDSNFPNKKNLYALVCETLKYREIIEDIFDKTKFLKREKQLKYNFALVLVYELLFGYGLKCGGKLKQCVSRNKSSLQSALAIMKVKAKVSRNEDLLPKKVLTAASIPRYVRINTLLTSSEKVVNHFKETGFTLVAVTETKLFVVGEKIFAQDAHIPDVLVFPPSTDLHDHPLYVKGHILLQDKASCLPAHVLDPPAGSHVIDACAAPGNKTSHLASRMNNKGKVFAFDIDNRRLNIMKNQMKKAGVTCVTMLNKSFLEVDPQSSENCRVEYIVVDPSCSGSGIVSRMDYLVNQQEEGKDFERRLESLSKFQVSALTHALSFPAVKKVVYSTCSIYKQENEDVVAKALEKTDGKFELSHALETWTNRGLPEFPGAEKCLRASPESDHTNGFFVALFTRKEDATSNEHQNSGKSNTPGGKEGSNTVDSLVVTTGSQSSEYFGNQTSDTEKCSETFQAITTNGDNRKVSSCSGEKKTKKRKKKSPVIKKVSDDGVSISQYNKPSNEPCVKRRRKGHMSCGDGSDDIDTIACSATDARTLKPKGKKRKRKKKNKSVVF